MSLKIKRHNITSVISWWLGGKGQWKKGIYFDRVNRHKVEKCNASVFLQILLGPRYVAEFFSFLHNLSSTLTHCNFC